MLNNLDALEKVSFLGFACVFWAKNHRGNPVATRQRYHEKKVLMLKPTCINILIVIPSSPSKKRKNVDPGEVTLRPGNQK